MRNCRVVLPLPPGTETSRREDEVLVWSRAAGEVSAVKPAPSKVQHKRHVRKYSEGELPTDRSFYFRGPGDKLNLRAQNLMLFVQLADGVDDETWRFHLRRRDVSQWFAQAIKDRDLAAKALAIEEKADMPPLESRAKIKAAIEQRYTLPASSFLPMPGTDSKPRLQKDTQT